MAQTAEQLAAARELATQYGLTAADFFQHKQSKAWLISRTGIEKIQYGAGIEVRFDAVRVEMEYAAVKATGTRATKPTAALLGGTLRIETFGSANTANCQVSYFLEMAEKRALSRVVLKLSDFYQLGVYGEDEMPSDQLTTQAKQASPAVVIAEDRLRRQGLLADIEAIGSREELERLYILHKDEIKADMGLYDALQTKGVKFPKSAP